MDDILKTTKCFFGITSVEFLGHIYDENGVLLSEKRVQGIRVISVPTLVSEVKIYVGMVNYFRDFIPSLSSYVNMTEPTKKKNFGKNGFEMT